LIESVSTKGQVNTYPLEARRSLPGDICNRDYRLPVGQQLSGVIRWKINGIYRVISAGNVLLAGLTG